MKVTKEQLLIEALNQFAKEDYDRVSLQSIGKALDITKGGVYHYFSSKDDLFKETVIYIIDILEQVSMGQFDPTRSLKEQLRPFFKLRDTSQMYAQIIGIDFFNDYSVLITLLFSAIKKFDEVRVRVSRIYTNAIESFTTLFSEAQTLGEIKSDRNPSVLAFELAALIEGGLLISAVTAIDEDLQNNVFEDFYGHLST